MNYYWIRIFDFQYQVLKAQKEEELKCDPDFPFQDYMLRDNKGTMLDEYYLCGDDMCREDCKQQVKERSRVDRFAKPKGKNGKSGIYALVLDSDKFFYDRFCVELDTHCFECGRPIKGKAKDFPKFNPALYDERFYTEKEAEAEIESEYGNKTEYHFCSFDCKRKCLDKLRGSEGEWQDREDYATNGGVYGYIYHIYNRREDKHYIGQTRYMPFFRWQEHAKQNIKGNICDLVFETVCEVRVKSQDYLNNIEAWWIQKYIDDYGRENVMNLTNPKITVANLVEQYQKNDGTLRGSDKPICGGRQLREANNAAYRRTAQTCRRQPQPDFLHPE